MKFCNVIAILMVMVFCLLGQQGWAGPEKKHSALPSDFAEFVEPGFPYFSTTFDARNLGKEWPANNLTIRAIIMDLGHGVHACFDTDLLRHCAGMEGEQGWRVVDDEQHVGGFLPGAE